MNTVRHIVNLPLPFAQKTQMAVAQPCASVMHAAKITDLTQPQLHAWEAALLSEL